MQTWTVALLVLLSFGLEAASIPRSQAPARKWTPKKTTAKSKAKKPKRKPVAKRDVWTAPNFADSAQGDRIEGEDPDVRRAAVEALGQFNGSIVVTEADTGRVLSIVNQKLAFQPGYIPCSTVKIYAALASLLEGHIDRNTEIPVSRSHGMNLTEALAHSNNPYFAQLGNQLGFEKVTYYGRLFGLGERAALNLEQERPGKLPDGIPREGLGMMTSFGSGIQQTPLQLASLLGAIANNGTLFWMQYPKNESEVKSFVPRVKRYLPIASVVPEIKPGLAGTVLFGTGQRANYSETEPLYGKTGTCTHSDERTHMGWFGSFNEVQGRKLVVVVMLTGARAVNGPVASQVAGDVYRNLSRANWFSQAAPRFSPSAQFLRPFAPVTQ